MGQGASAVGSDLSGHLGSAHLGTATLGRAGRASCGGHLRRCTEHFARSESPQIAFSPSQLERNKNCATSARARACRLCAGTVEVYVGKAVPEGWQHPGSAVPTGATCALTAPE